MARTNAKILEEIKNQIKENEAKPVDNTTTPNDTKPADNITTPNATTPVNETKPADNTTTPVCKEGEFIFKGKCAKCP